MHNDRIPTCTHTHDHAHVHITECRWEELVKAIKHCNQKAQYCL